MRWTKPGVVEMSVGLEINGYMPNDELPPDVERLGIGSGRPAARSSRGKQT
ncbi:pyrroloquinoline quinone precursor peptide PqqA [Rhizobium leguminosarum]